MARSSHSSHRGPRGQGSGHNTWAVSQSPRPMPRLVRLGRAANDNGRRTSLKLRVIVVALATALVVMALHDWRLI